MELLSISTGSTLTSIFIASSMELLSISTGSTLTSIFIASSMELLSMVDVEREVQMVKYCVSGNDPIIHISTTSSQLSSLSNTHKHINKKNAKEILTRRKHKTKFLLLIIIKSSIMDCYKLRSKQNTRCL
ncbi:hypothetical protein AMTRI_Chr01g111640 [Amborella trichopoda]